MALFTMAPAISAGLSLANANKIKNKSKLTKIAQNQAASDKYKDDIESFTNSAGPSSTEIKNYLGAEGGGLYQGAFNRDPEFNDDPSNTADYWVDAVSKGQHGTRDWKEWLAASIYGSDEKKGMSPIDTPATDTPATDTPATDTPATDTPATDTPATDTPATDSGGMNMDKFMQFMMFMNMMRPQGGFGGGSQYGYGGLNPGGVQSAYNPMDNFQGMMDNFKSLSSGLLN